MEGEGDGCCEGIDDPVNEGFCDGVFDGFAENVGEKDGTPEMDGIGDG